MGGTTISSNTQRDIPILYLWGRDAKIEIDFGFERFQFRPN